MKAILTLSIKEELVSMQVLSEKKIKQLQSFNYSLGTMTCNISKIVKNYLAIWLKPVVPLASAGQDGPG